MRKLLAAIALVACASAGAQAQQMDHAKMDHAKMDHAKMHMQGMSHDSSMMKSTCPLHLATLDLSAAQQATVDSVRKAHQADMKTLMKKYAGQKDAKLSPADKEAMEKSMAAAIGGTRAVLTDSQKVKFDAAVTAHGAQCDMMHGHAMPKG